MNAIRSAAILALLLACTAGPPLAAQDAQPEKVLVGPLTIDQLLDIPGWFGDDFLRYAPEPYLLDDIAPLMKDVDIVCVLGTWCDDSKRDVPRMFRIMQARNIPPEKITLIGVDKEKRSPGGENITYSIEKVPTFVFFRHGQEIGRIVEQPVGSLAKHMLAILMGRDPNEQPPPPVQLLPDGTVINPGGSEDSTVMRPPVPPDAMPPGMMQRPGAPLPGNPQPGMPPGQMRSLQIGGDQPTPGAVQDGRNAPTDAADTSSQVKSASGAKKSGASGTRPAKKGARGVKK